jgi:3-methyladenine DNA glycosylase AlkD
MDLASVLKHLKSLSSPKNVEGMARFGIVTRKSYGIPTPILKAFAKEVKKAANDRHALALELWKSGIYDARAVAFWIDDPKQVTKKQMDAWARDFDNWGTVDGTCCYLFCRTPFAYEKAVEWSAKKPEFIKRAGFALMAYLAVHDKTAPDTKIAAFLSIIERETFDERNFVKKAVNWALRQIGKRSVNLNKLAIAAAQRIKSQNTSAARWIASDALRELRNPQIAERLRKKAK